MRGVGKDEPASKEDLNVLTGKIKSLAGEVETLAKGSRQWPSPNSDSLVSEEDASGSLGSEWLYDEDVMPPAPAVHTCARRVHHKDEPSSW